MSPHPLPNYTGPVSNVLGRAPLMSLILLSNSSPTIPEQPQHTTPLEQQQVAALLCTRFQQVRQEGSNV